MRARFALGFLALPALLQAQSPSARSRAAAAPVDTSHSASAGPGAADQEEHTTTQHAITINGQRIEYDATIGSVILRDTADKPVASIFYTAYIRRGVTDLSHRPLTFAYNGGPGSSSIWLHMGAFGPRRVETPDAEHAPPPPYHLVDNAYSLIDKTDLVFIDPVGTGFSKPLGAGTGKMFWGVDQDVRSLSQFVRRYLSENSRWNSPRYLLGESYGTTRSAALADYLQTRDDIDLNGVVLISSVLDFQTITFNAGNDVPFIMYLPSYAAVAWYHKALPNRPATLRPLLDEVERFATGEYATALLAGDKLPAADRARIVARLHQYTGLDTAYLSKANLRVNAPEFEAELLREHGETVGRLDARFVGPAGDPLAQYADYDPQSAAVSSAFVSLFNDYLRGELNYPKDKQYTVSGNVNPWDWNHPATRGWPGHTNVAVDLAEALGYNTHLRVQLHSGLLDLATPYFGAEWTMDHLGVPPALRSRISEVEYEAGHMMYLHEPSLAKLKQSIAGFLDATSGQAGTKAVTDHH